MKTSRDTKSLTQPGKSGVGVKNNIRAGCDDSKFDKSGIGDNEFDDEVDDEVGKKGRNPTKSKNLSKFKKTELSFLISGARIVFTKLRQVFIKAPIFYHIDPESYIQVETDVLEYVIDGVFSYLTLDNLG